MPWGLERFQQTGDLDFHLRATQSECGCCALASGSRGPALSLRSPINFTCHRRAQLLGTPQARDIFEVALERVRGRYGL
ncbi:MAG TPA: hypothetical protein VK738_12960 [Terriglobales bacterium]|nr:hypothetical protein [Terriglobales bacterium]